MKYLYIATIILLSYFAKSDAVCKTLFAKGVSAAEQNIIVNRHNEIRLDIANGRVPNQPQGKNLKRMSWDTKLAEAAQRIAETCVFEHVKVNDSRFYVGQNLFWSGYSAPNTIADWVGGINAWFNEHKTYQFGTKTYNHYTQVVWADTNLVGCGYTNYKNGDKWYEKLYVCNYGPGGNYVGRTPYEVGKGCENLC